MARAVMMKVVMIRRILELQRKELLLLLLLRLMKYIILMKTVMKSHPLKRKTSRKE